MNEATCKQIQNSYQCVCAPGWTGKVCDVEMVSCKDAAIRKGISRILTFIIWSKLKGTIMMTVCWCNRYTKRVTLQ